MRRLYFLTTRLARRAFRASGIRVPGPVRRLNRYLRRTIGAPSPRGPEPQHQDFGDELAALNRRVERLETESYLDSIGHRRDR